MQYLKIYLQIKLKYKNIYEANNCLYKLKLNK